MQESKVAKRLEPRLHLPRAASLAASTNRHLQGSEGNAFTSRDRRQLLCQPHKAFSFQSKKNKLGQKHHKYLTKMFL